MKRSRFVTEFSVGFVLFVATTVVIVSLFVVGDGLTLFTHYVEYKVLCPIASGLKSGSKVYLSGVPVGTVSRIDLPKDLTVKGVPVTVSIQRAYANRIRENSYAWLQSEGLLGDVSINVLLGTAEKEALPPGAVIPYRARSLLDEFAGEEIMTGTTDLLRETISMLKEVNKGEGTIGMLLRNPELYKNLNDFTISMDVTTRQLQSITKEFEDVITEVRSQKGTLGKLIFSDDYAKSIATAVNDANATLKSLRDVAEEIRSGKGSVGKLLADSSLHDAGVKALGDVSQVSTRLDSILQKAESQKSLLGRVALDGEMGQDVKELVSKLDRSAGSLERILTLLERGEGSLGMLLRDPSIAASLRDVFLGVSEYGVVQSVVRNAERAGREAYLRDLDFAKREEREVRKARALAEIKRHQSQPGSTSDGKPVPAAAKEEDGKKGPATEDAEKKTQD
jgi:phospholipid/cholesterol/gamma-HCH transport system substrate-binding protein